MRIAFDARTLCTPKTGDRTVTTGLLQGMLALAEPEGLEIIAVSDRPIPTGLLRETAALRMHMAPWPRGYAWTWLAFPRALRAVKADVAVLQYMAPQRLPCPFVTFIHDTVWRSMPETFPWRDRLVLDTFIPSTIAHAAAVCTGSHFAASEISRHYPHAAGKLHVVPYGVEARFRPVTDQQELRRVRAKYSLPERFVLSVGVLQPRKNVEALVHAYQRLPAPLRAQHGLVIVGKHGWLMKHLPALAREAGPDVQFTGYADDEDLPALYTLAECFAYPSLYEGYGLPPLEAMACGTPVLTSNVASLPEVTAGAALCVDPTDVQSLQDGLQRMLTDTDLRRELVTRGLERAAGLTWGPAAQGLLGVLRAVVAEGWARSRN
ncbi:MAG: glycosyltransferase family 4 protein [Armatimonadetes bacterium]|nr:glycosyltransferase family 4 protein [Armatimonadota bacterium]